MTISVISPVYGCKKGLSELYERLVATLSKITPLFEIIFVEDNCPQGSWEILKEIANGDTRVKTIKLSRNFGQHYAITAGLDHAKGDYIIVMDCDLQDKPEEIEMLYKKALEGYDIVFGRRVERQDRFLKRFTAWLYYKALEYFTDSEHDHTIGNFGIYSKKVIDTVNSFREHNRNFPLFVKLAGFKKTEIPISHQERTHGKSSYSIAKLINLAIDSIVAHSNKPLRLSIKFGFTVSLLALLYAVFLVVRYFCCHDPIEGWTSLMVSMFFMFGVMSGLLGILGLYIGKIFDEVKNRPLYIIEEKINL